MNKFLLFLILSISSVNAQINYTFDNGGGDNKWETSSNWNPDGTPGSNDNVEIIDYEVTIGTDLLYSNPSVNNLDVIESGGNAKLTVRKTSSLTVNGDVFLDNATVELR